MNLDNINLTELNNEETLSINGGGEAYARWFGKVIRNMILPLPLAIAADMYDAINGK